jgi:hypothetical protein
MTTENRDPLHPEPVPSRTTHLRPDGTVFPPVTPDPPPPPGYESPLDTLSDMDVDGDGDHAPPV